MNKELFQQTSTSTSTTTSASKAKCVTTKAVG